MAIGRVFSGHPPTSGRRTRDRTLPRDSARLRILAITLASGLSGALLYSHTGGQISGQPVWLITGGLYAAMIGLCAIVIFRFFPRFGPFLGYTSATRLMLATTCALAPEVAARVTGAPLLNATLIVGGALALQAMVRVRRGAAAGSTLRAAS